MIALAGPHLSRSFAVRSNAGRSSRQADSSSAERVAGQQFAFVQEAEKGRDAVRRARDQIGIRGELARKEIEQVLLDVGAGPVAEAAIAVAVLPVEHRAGDVVARPEDRPVLDMSGAHVLIELLEQRLEEILEALLVLGIDVERAWGRLEEETRKRASATAERARDQWKADGDVVRKDELELGRTGGGALQPLGQLVAGEPPVIDPAEGLSQHGADLAPRRRWGQQALHERSARLLPLDHQGRQLALALARSLEHDEQPVGALVLDDARLAQLHAAHAPCERGLDALGPQALERRRGLAGERLAGEHGERLEQGGGADVGAPLCDRGHDSGELGERRQVEEREEGGGLVLEIGGLGTVRCLGEELLDELLEPIAQIGDVRCRRKLGGGAGGHASHRRPGTGRNPLSPPAPPPAGLQHVRSPPRCGWRHPVRA